MKRIINSFKQSLVFFRSLDAAMIVSFLVAAVIAFIADRLESLTWHFTVFLMMYVLCLAYWVWHPKGADHATRQFRRWGIGTAVGVYVVVAIEVGLRIEIGPRFQDNLPLAGFGAASLLGLWALWILVVEGERTVWVMVYLGAVGNPGVIAWIITSLVYWPGPEIVPRTRPLDGAALRQAVQATLDDRNRRGREAGGVTVALALSGGGYRAATIHTGVLKVLENRRMPLTYLTTVSGGSIVGAYYALGHPPEEFEKLLKAEKPGLPNHYFHIFYYLGELLCPWWSDSNTYDRHFSRTYFGKARLREVAGLTLLVNATHYEGRHREVFSGPTGRWSEESIASVVAASGAFPGAFEPKKIGKGYYIDGGVVENLGLEGLRAYLRDNDFLPKPDVLIISNASQEAEVPKVREKMFRFTLLNDAATTSYESLHEQLFRLYTDNAYNAFLSERPQPYSQRHSLLFGGRSSKDQKGREKILYTFILDGTSGAERDYMQTEGGRAEREARQQRTTSVITRATVKEVAKFATLKELDPEEVEKGGWVGTTIARKYVDLIRCYVERLKEGKDPASLCGTSQ